MALRDPSGKKGMKDPEVEGKEAAGGKVEGEDAAFRTWPRRKIELTGKAGGRKRENAEWHTGELWSCQRTL